MITILHRGGYGQKITILHREGGVYRDPQKWLRNLWMTPNGLLFVVEICQNRKNGFIKRLQWKCLMEHNFTTIYVFVIFLLKSHYMRSMEGCENIPDLPPPFLVLYILYFVFRSRFCPLEIRSCHPFLRNWAQTLLTVTIICNTNYLPNNWAIVWGAC